MQLLGNKSQLSKVPTVATIGFFDGFHLGHKFLVEKVKDYATLHGFKSLVVTFSEHPKNVILNRSEVKLISTCSEKQQLIEYSGVDFCLMMNFNLELSRLTAKEFLQFLKENFCLHTLFVGYDHTFGSDKIRDFSTIKHICQTIGIEAIKVEPLLKNGSAISSSRIRKLLGDGCVGEASELLGYDYQLYGEVVNGFQNGKKIGFPTANISVSQEKLLPKQGVYAAEIELQGKSLQGMMNIGSRPTMNGASISVEVNIFNFDKDIYGECITVFPKKFIREEVKFNGLESLKNQLISDREKIISILNC